MKRILTAVLLASAATAAYAADLPSRKAAPAPAPVYVAPAFTWTGFYLGVNGGYGFADMHGSGSARFGRPAGGLLGVTAGYNYQIGQFVVGLESDLDWADLKKSKTTALGTSTMRISAVETALARFGFAADRALFYVAGGYAGAEMRGKFSDPAFGNSATSGWRNGVGVGGGVEYAFTNNVTAKAEYIYAPLESKTYFGGTPDAAKAGANLSIFRTGLNYKF